MNEFYGIVILVGLIGGVMLYRSWRRQQEWRGIVTRIEERPAEWIDGLDINDHVEIHYLREDGRVGKIRLEKRKFERLYFGLREGDALVKEAGDDYPHKV